MPHSNQLEQVLASGKFRTLSQPNRNANKVRDFTVDLEAVALAGHIFSAELDLEQLVLKVTETGVELSGAEFGAFFYNIEDDNHQLLQLNTIVGADPSKFAALRRPRMTALLSPQHTADGVICVGDVQNDPRFTGLPEGHLPVRSFISVPVEMVDGRQAGTLLFGHTQPNKFNQRTEMVCRALAAQAAIAFDNALLFRATKREIELRRKAERELEASREQLRRITEYVPSVLWSGKSDGSLTYLNQSWAEYTGQRVEEALPWNWINTIHPEDRERLEQAWEHARATGTRYSLEARIRRYDGDYRWFCMSAEPIYDEVGDIFAWPGITYDIHDRKMAEMLLVELNETLERRVAERTAELEETNHRLIEEINERQFAQEAYRQAQKMESVGQLTGGIAHDFNNMLSVIIGNLELIRMSIGGVPNNSTTTRINRNVNMALEAATKAERLTAQLLAFSRKTRLQPERLNVNEVICGIVDMVQRTIGKSITIETDLNDDLWLCLSDRTQLESAIVNLAINARDAMSHGGTLTLKTQNKVITNYRNGPEQKYVSVQVIDTGVGMPNHIKEKAFDPFFTTKDVGKGTGLGLSQVYGFCQQSNGKVELHSEIGQGTTVEMLFPFASGQPSSANEDVTESEQQQTAATILVVDDEPGVREFACTLLEDIGYNVVAAEDGRKAIDIIKQSQIHIDLVFTDVVMPNGVDGFGVAKAVEEIRPGTPVIFATGHAEVILSESKYNYQSSIKVIGKPYRVAELTSAISSTLTAAKKQP